jgi:hypothetical protein
MKRVRPSHLQAALTTLIPAEQIGDKPGLATRQSAAALGAKLADGPFTRARRPLFGGNLIDPAHKAFMVMLSNNEAALRRRPLMAARVSGFGRR